MKILLFIGFLIYTGSSLGQQVGDNTIIIPTSITADKIKEILFSQGYIVEGQDEKFIITAPKSMKRFATVMKLSIFRNDTSVYIKGQMRITVEAELWGSIYKHQFEQVDFRKSKNNINREGWDEMMVIASMIGGSPKFIKQ